MSPETETEAKAKSGKKAAEPAEKAKVEAPAVDLGWAVESLEGLVESLALKVVHLEGRFTAFLTGLSDNFGKEYVQKFRAEE